MADLWDWSSTAASNVTLDGINVNTGMTPANVDNSIRSLMSVVRSSFTSGLKDFLKGVAGAYLPVAYGGTGGGDAATARTNLGALSDAYRDVPVIEKTSAFTFADSERGKGIYYSGSAAAATIDPYTTTPITIGAVFPIRVGVSAGALTVTPSGVGLYKNGSTSSGSAIIAPGGYATLIHWSSNEWTIVGVGVS